MNEVIQYLQEISKQAERTGGAQELISAMNSLRAAIKKSENSAALEVLDTEISTWQAKLPVIMREPAGRHGMAHHCHYWIEKLKAGKK